MAEAPSSSSSSSLFKGNKVMKDHHGLMTESEVDAAHNLMQLSDEEKSSNMNIRGSKRSRSNDEQEVDQRASDIIMAKMQEIFGKDIEVFPTKKQRRYRSLVNIYMVTRPVKAGNDTRVKA